MQTRAAILREPRTDWSVESIELDDPKAQEVKVKLTAAGLCHSDEHLRTGDMVLDPEIAELMGWNQFPCVGGHEGAGEVVEVGPGVTSLKEGDHVVLSFIPSCGRCPSCAMGQQHLCDYGSVLLGGRQISDNTTRHHSAKGEDLGTMCLTGTFAPYTVVNEASCIRIDDWIPLDRAALLGCGVTTGWGAAVNAAGVRAGETVVVIGLGGIGMNAVQGAALAGARHLIAVDPVEWKRKEAVATFGATHAAASMEEAAALLAEMTWGANAEKVILTTGTATGDLIQPMMGMVSKGGRGVVTAVAPIAQEDVKLSLFDLAMQRKELVGCIFGNANPRRDITRLLRLYEDGRLKLDELMTRTYSLDEINQGYQDMLDGKNLRGVIKY
ncbi:NDMA-dependent alcohol dehydrogenase [Actinomadura sp. WMMB 499]|uniref:NDMA-dependent alcohol dehydrogenase n=1 Tax=Actinomadura sp. WMMB 499 TaxID=1219491 RepID=UPI001245C348|nr:NDMA-dependent alcohol dehydrogenase [Actinomadura sp. WMMB 499]QFG20756.1 NDMA-dependent alcohol dehydrogenase [Actinomadura sp. WMMB 499]